MHQRVAVALVVLLRVSTASGAQPAKAAWRLEKTPALLRLTRGTGVDYGVGKYTVQLVVECLLDSKQVTARLETEVKSGGPFTVRFDAEPAVTMGGGKPVWSNERQMHLLTVPLEAMPRFLDDARTSKEVMIRHEFSSVPYDARFDLGGFGVAFKALAEACGVPDPQPRAAAAQRAPRPSPRAPRTIGNWYVTESLSSVDDKLIVVTTASDKLQTMQMFVRCRENTVEVFYVPARTVFNPDSGEKTVSVDVTLDGGESVRHVGATAEHFKAMFIEDGRAFVQSLAGHKSLALKWTPYRERETKTSTFALDGFDEASRAVLAACPAE
jgi:hypothetical protein